MHYLCSHKTPQTMDTDRTNGTGTLRYSDIFLAMYSDNGMSCLHRNHSHVLVYMYSGERHRGDSEPGGDVVLWHPPDNFRVCPQQFLVALLRRVPDAGQEELLVTVEAVDDSALRAGKKDIGHLSLLQKQCPRRNAVKCQNVLAPHDGNDMYCKPGRR